MELYRAKKNGEWIYGGVYDTANDGFLVYLVVEENSELKRIAVDDFTRCRYTGYSANGTKIFDKDILKLKMLTDCGPYAKCELTVVIDSSQSSHLQLLEQASSIEIIGNIIDNKELAKELF